MTSRLFVSLSLSPEVVAFAQETVIATQTRLKSASRQMRWVDPDMLHVTLQFIGNVENKHIPALIRSLSMLSSPPPITTPLNDYLGCRGIAAFQPYRDISLPFSPLPPHSNLALKPTTIGLFPENSRKSVSVMWLGVEVMNTSTGLEDNEVLNRMHHRVRNAINSALPIGEPLADEFRPHITLARCSRNNHNNKKSKGKYEEPNIRQLLSDPLDIQSAPPTMELSHISLMQSLLVDGKPSYVTLATFPVHW